MRHVRAFLRLARPRFLLGGIFGFALGAAVASFEGIAIAWPSYALGQLMVTAFHLMVHFANDYYDRHGDVLATRTPWSGGSGALVDGSLAPRVALIASLACATAGTVATAIFAVRGNFVAAGLGAAIGLLCWSYSAPPMRLLARGWGELDTAAIIAVLFPLAGYATFAGALDERVFLSTLPSAAAMFVLMFCVELPDVDADRQCGKRNLVVRVGPQRARLLIYAAIGASYVACAAAVFGGAASTMALFSLLTIPAGWRLVEQLAAGGREGSFPADIAGRGVAFFVTTAIGSTLAYVAVL